MKPLSSFKPQAVFSDIDGTLLTSEHVVSPLTSSAILFLQHEALPASVLLLKKMISIVVPLHSVVH